MKYVIIFKVKNRTIVKSLLYEWQRQFVSIFNVVLTVDKYNECCKI